MIQKLMLSTLRHLTWKVWLLITPPLDKYVNLQMSCWLSMKHMELTSTLISLCQSVLSKGVLMRLYAVSTRLLVLFLQVPSSMLARIRDCQLQRF